MSLIRLPESRVSQWLSVHHYALSFDVKQHLILIYLGQVAGSCTYGKDFTLKRCKSSCILSVDQHKNKLQKQFTLQSWRNTVVPPLIDTRTHDTTIHSSEPKKHRGTSVNQHTNTLHNSFSELKKHRDTSVNQHTNTWHNNSLYRAEETPWYLR